MASESTMETTGTNRALNAVRTGQRQKQLLIKRLFKGNAFSLLTAHANGRPFHDGKKVRNSQFGKKYDQKKRRNI